MADKQLAQQVHIDPNNGDVTIDGKAFGFYLAEDGVSIELAGANTFVHRVTLTLLAENVSIEPRTPTSPA